MERINSFDYNFSSGSMIGKNKISDQIQNNIVKSFSNNFNSNINIKSNVQKKNKTATIVKKKSV